ncbi:hypothetical protein GBA52_016669 [Prunus armeniaca]|nr:hypothetical protein GBA52_016669 [Prunus armeniaca]
MKKEWVVWMDGGETTKMLKSPSFLLFTPSCLPTGTRIKPETWSTMSTCTRCHENHGLDLEATNVNWISL